MRCEANQKAILFTIEVLKICFRQIIPGNSVNINPFQPMYARVYIALPYPTGLYYL